MTSITTTPIQLTVLKRRFVFGGMRLADPGRTLTPQQVQAFHARAYPELANSVIEDKLEGDTVVYSFRKAVGTKGGVVQDLLDRLEREAPPDLSGAMPTVHAMRTDCSGAVAALLSASGNGDSVNTLRLPPFAQVLLLP